MVNMCVNIDKVGSIQGTKGFAFKHKLRYSNYIGCADQL